MAYSALVFMGGSYQELANIPRRDATLFLVREENMTKHKLSSGYINPMSISWASPPPLHERVERINASFDKNFPLLAETIGFTPSILKREISFTKNGVELFVTFGEPVMLLLHKDWAMPLDKQIRLR